MLFPIHSTVQGRREKFQSTDILVNYESPQGGAGILACRMGESALNCEPELFLKVVWWIQENSLACGLSNFICKELNTSYLASAVSIHHHWHWNFRVVLKRSLLPRWEFSTQSLSDRRFPVDEFKGPRPIWKLYFSSFSCSKEPVTEKSSFPSIWSPVRPSCTRHS